MPHDNRPKPPWGKNVTGALLYLLRVLDDLQSSSARASPLSPPVDGRWGELLQRPPRNCSIFPLIFAIPAASLASFSTRGRPVRRFYGSDFSPSGLYVPKPLPSTR